MKITGDAYFPPILDNVDDFFKLAMFYELPNLKEIRSYPYLDPDEIVLDIGSSPRKKIIKAIKLDLPEYDAECDKIPFEDETVQIIHCHHVMEHINNLQFFLSEISRVLKPKGIIYITVPHYKSSMAHHDILHVRTFTIDSFDVLLDNKFYNTNKSLIDLEVLFKFQCGVNDRNMVILFVLGKKK